MIFSIQHPSLLKNQAQTLQVHEQGIESQKAGATDHQAGEKW
jgi:hypothetical protein